MARDINEVVGVLMRVIGGEEITRNVDIPFLRRGCPRKRGHDAR